MKTFLKILGVILLIAGAALAAFTDVAIADYIGIATAAVGFVLTIISVWNKSEKKDWKVIVSIILIVIGAGALAFAGFSEQVVTQVIAVVAGLVALIVGIIIPTVTAKKAVEEKTE